LIDSHIIYSFKLFNIFKNKYFSENNNNSLKMN